MGQVAGGTTEPALNPLAAGCPVHFNFARDVVDRWAETRPDALALWHVQAPSGIEQRFTFRQIAKRSLRAAGLFRTAGIQPGDTVLVMLPRVPQWWITMLGLIRLGAVPVPATLLLTHRDAEFRLEQARVKAAITSPEGIAKLANFSGLKFLAGGEADGWISLDKGLETAADFAGVATRADDPGILYFTSATTGLPKMVLHTQASYGLGHRLTGALWLDLKPDDLHWNISDLGWGKAAWSSFYGPWQMGACVFAFEAPGKFDPHLTLSALEEYPITSWCTPPTALRLIVRENLGKRRFPALRHCVTAGEPLNPEVFNLWNNATGLSLYEGYGQSETVVMIANMRSLNLPIKPGSMGVPVPGMPVTLLDDELNEIPPDSEGEIALRLTPQRPIGLFKGYLAASQQNEQAFVGDFYLTGDRARRDCEGYYWFIGRKDDVIKSSGYRIGPFEVESALIEHPAVLDVAVVGKPDQLRGQIVKAFVVLRAGYEAHDGLVPELQSHCKSLIAAYKYPREIEFVPELPKTTSGKTRRVDLR